MPASPLTFPQQDTSWWSTSGYSLLDASMAGSAWPMPYGPGDYDSSLFAAMPFVPNHRFGTHMQASDIPWPGPHGKAAPGKGVYREECSLESDTQQGPAYINIGCGGLADIVFRKPGCTFDELPEQ
jgi:hypothetical protein